MSGRNDDDAAELRLAAAVGAAREQWPAPAALERVKRGVNTAIAGATPSSGPIQARLLRQSTRSAWLRGGGLALLIGAGFGAWRVSVHDTQSQDAAVLGQPAALSAQVAVATAVSPVPVLPPATEVRPLAPVLANSGTAPALRGGAVFAELRRKPQRARPARPALQDVASETAAGANDPESELALLRRALGALQAQPMRSLELAAQHERDYAQGIFGQEREVIAIDALVALQRTGAAEARARRFLESYPRSAHAPRIRTLLGEHEQRPSGKDSMTAAGRSLAKAEKKAAAQGRP